MMLAVLAVFLPAAAALTATEALGRPEPALMPINLTSTLKDPSVAPLRNKTLGVAVGAALQDKKVVLMSAHALGPKEASLQAAPCTACSDTPDSYMITTGKTCSGDTAWNWAFRNKCNTPSTSSYWTKNKFCRLSCYNNGVGYEGDVCCQSPPSPSPSPSPSPPPPDVCKLAVAEQWHSKSPNIFGLNQVVGPAFQIDYHEPALIEAAKIMNVGSLRYPGGTVANYWYIPNATFGLPCHHEGKTSHASGDEGVAGRHDKCNKKANVDRFNGYSAQGKQTMRHFYEGFGMASPTAEQKGPLWAINMLSVEREKVVEQIYYLSNMSTYFGIPVEFIEFGNEIFISSHYGDFFPNATSYWNAVSDGVALARVLLPHAKLATPIGYKFCKGHEDQEDGWDLELAQFAHMFDALAIHDYTACYQSIDEGPYADLDQRRQALLAWGSGVAIKHHNLLRRVFPNDADRLEFWVTEWGTTAWVGNPFMTIPEMNMSTTDFQRTGYSGIFAASYLLAALAPASAWTSRTTMMDMHTFVSDDSTGYGAESAQIMLANDTQPGQVKGRVCAMAQIFSHLAELTLLRSGGAVYLNASSSCGTLGFKLDRVKGSESLSCLQSVAFTEGGAESRFVAVASINRCLEPKAIVDFDTYPGRRGFHEDGLRGSRRGRLDCLRGSADRLQPPLGRAPCARAAHLPFCRASRLVRASADGTQHHHVCPGGHVTLAAASAAGAAATPNARRALPIAGAAACSVLTVHQ